MNEVANRQTGTAVANPNDNYFQQYGDQVSQQTIVGKLLKFSKGDYLVGQDNEEMATGTKLVANMDEMMVGWIRWSDNKPTDHIMGRIADGYQPPKRNTLGDDDKDKWEVDNQGQQRDPWQFSNYLVMKEVDGEELYTFTASSKGGLNALGELCKVYGKAMRQRPAEFPIITLGVDSYAHSNKSFGRIKFPVFEVTGWAPKSEFADALANETAATTAVDEAATETPAPKPAAAKTAAAKKTAAAETRF